MDQRSPEWWEARAGKVTASKIGDLMARTKTGWSTSRKHYMDAIVVERLTGRPAPQRAVASLERRQEMEPEARVAYEFYSDNLVEEVGFIEHPTIPNAGASPDGLVGADGGLEIKCPDGAQHVEMVTTGVIDKGYIYQMQFGMACTEREWWDFVSYDPTMPEEMKVYVQRVRRDDAQIAEIEKAVIEFLSEAEKRVEHIKAVTSGRSPLEVALRDSLAITGRKPHVVQ